MSEGQLDLLEWLAAQPPDTLGVTATADAAPAEVDVTPVRLTRTDPACNMDRFYSLEFATSLFGEWGVVRHWGRIGTSGRTRTDWYTTAQEAEAAYQDLLQAKQRRRYTP